MSIQSEINRIKDAVINAVNAIKSKGVTVPTTAKIDDLASLVLSIPQLDASNANALPSQVVEGSKFVGANGVVEEGTMPIYGFEALEAIPAGVSGDGFVFDINFEKPTVIEEYVMGKVPMSYFGNAQRSDVRKGKTFTSAAGVEEEGAMPDGEYGVRIGLSGEEGYVAVEGTNVVLEETTTQPSSGYYIKATGQGKVSCCGEAVIHTAGYIEKGSKFGGGEDIEYPDGSFAGWSDPKTKYYTIATEEKTVAPSTSVQNVTPTSGKLLSKVTVDPIPTTSVATPAITATADDEESEIWIRATNRQAEGYVSAKNTYVDIYANLTVEGDTATMECGGASISRKVGASIATCTVNVTFSTNAGNTLISATTFANGAISTVNNDFTNNNSGKSVTIPNVVCGSALSVNTQFMVSLYWSGNTQVHSGLLGGTITVPSTTGTYTVEVGVVDD